HLPNTKLRASSSCRYPQMLAKTANTHLYSCREVSYESALPGRPSIPETGTCSGMAGEVCFRALIHANRYRLNARRILAGVATTPRLPSYTSYETVSQTRDPYRDPDLSNP